jgi:hypothetical protein
MNTTHHTPAVDRFLQTTAQAFCPGVERFTPNPNATAARQQLGRVATKQKADKEECDLVLTSRLPGEPIYPDPATYLSCDARYRAHESF